MTNKTDVLIIGGGAVGVCIAHYVRASGRSVALVERDRLAAGCSEKNAGLIVPSHVIPLAAPGVISQGLKWMFKSTSPFYIKPRLNLDLISWLWKFRASCTSGHVDRSIPVLYDLTQASLSLFSQLGEGEDFGLRHAGLLMVYNSKKGRLSCEELLAPSRKAGLQIDSLDEQALYDLEPQAPENMTGAVYYPGDAHLDPSLMVRKLAERLEGEGVAIHTGCNVTGFQRNGRNITGVRTDKGLMEADQVILAGGAWSPEIIRELSLNIPVQPAKGYSLTLNGPSRSPKIPMILCEAKSTVTPLQDSIRFAGTLELAGLDLSINKKRAASIFKVIPQYFEGFDLETLDWSKVWAGFRPCSPDGLPYIGRADGFDNLVVATGHAMVGITLAPITGKLVSELIEEKPTSLDLAPMNVARFA